MKAEKISIACTIIIILSSMWFLLRELTILRRIETELGVEFVNPLVAFICMAVLIAFMINSLIKDLREISNQEKTRSNKIN